jgi:hypothetical protein
MVIAILILLGVSVSHFSPVGPLPTGCEYRFFPDWWPVLVECRAMSKLTTAIRVSSGLSGFTGRYFFLSGRTPVEILVPQGFDSYERSAFLLVGAQVLRRPVRNRS